MSSNKLENQEVPNTVEQFVVDQQQEVQERRRREALHAMLTGNRRKTAVDADDGFYRTRKVKSGEDAPVDERVPHAGGDGRGLRRVAQPEHALNDRQLGAGGLQAAERTPVVDDHPRRNHLAPPVHGTRLYTSASGHHEHANRPPANATMLSAGAVPVPLLTTRGTCRSDDSSSWSSMDVFG